MGKHIYIYTFAQSHCRFLFTKHSFSHTQNVTKVFSYKCLLGNYDKKFNSHFNIRSSWFKIHETLLTINFYFSYVLENHGLDDWCLVYFYLYFDNWKVVNKRHEWSRYVSMLTCGWIYTKRVNQQQSALLADSWMTRINLFVINSMLYHPRSVKTEVALSSTQHDHMFRLCLKFTVS